MKRLPLTWAEIDLGRLRRNLRSIRRAIGDPRVGILAIVKADAYGHGMRPVASALWRDGVRFFGVASLDEALELRKALPKARILVLGSFHEEQVDLYVKKKITPTVCSVEDVQALLRALPRASKRTSNVFPVHVKVDTGMGRLGVWHENAAGFFRKLAAQKRLEVEGLYTHFARADHEDRKFTDEQIRLFESATREARAAGLRPKFLHAANSMGLVRFRRAHLNLVRPGLILYGIRPASGTKGIDVEPILSLKSRIEFLKPVEKGRALSYGATYRASARTRVATLPVGYSHGYRVGFSNRAFVLVNGRRCPVVGRVTMDHTLVDVGPAGNVRRWDEVILIGRNGKAAVTAENLAELAGTIPYEIVCSLHSRIPRIYKRMRS